jgi:hypothetical protein
MSQHSGNDLLLGETTVSARQLSPFEVLPEELRTQVFPPDPPYTLDFSQVWVAESEGRVCAFLVTAIAHELAVFLRIAATKDAPHMWAVVLLRRALSDLKQRGCQGFLVLLSDSKPMEQKLANIVLRYGGAIEPVTGSWGAARIK